VVHVYFHDTDLLSARRRHALTSTLALLGRRCRPIDLDELAHASSVDVARDVPFDQFFRGRNAASGQ
jgi:hypothetical protein